MKLGIVGYGTVGSTLGTMALRRGLAVSRADPVLHDSASIDELVEQDVVLICVPTPGTAEGPLDTSLVSWWIDQLACGPTLVVVSTVNPGTFASERERHPAARLALVPEFLRAAHAASDFAATRRVILGTDRSDTASVVGALYARLLPGARIHHCSPLVAEVTKLASNAFLAMKVTFANELFDVCASAGADWSTVADLLALDLRIGPSHLEVTKERGFGGHCLPKDTSALDAWLGRPTAQPTLIRSVLLRNLELRRRPRPTSATAVNDLANVGASATAWTSEPSASTE